MVESVSRVTGSRRKDRTRLGAEDRKSRQWFRAGENPVPQKPMQQGPGSVERVRQKLLGRASP